ncbi:uncharacterized protein LOC120119132 [Hibiscus syriacus]|uniref:uncharacterized protein LOC120119132 n=1 Tax=Hibiscus syriacus TaxID=106335 RepID=UPI001923EB22|nr:uncharacterized protein LOC120119132 [Hibiscus syriacus]
MGFSESRHGCKKHPDHQGNQGVCPSCIRERLSRLCSSSSSYKESMNSRVAPSLLFSPADQNLGLPPLQGHFKWKKEKKKEKEKKGFWSKLVGFKRKKKDSLTHSSSMRFIIGRAN